jgi:hypothetical protein
MITTNSIEAALLLGSLRPGKYDLEKGVTFELFESGTHLWKRDGQIERVGGPALVHWNGTREWWIGGKRHRENEPAIVRGDGTQEWWINGKRVQK